MVSPNTSPTLQAPSAVRRSGMSTTLPRNFAPLSLSHMEDAPRTPDRTFAELKLPPPPPHSTYRVRRSRLNLDNFQTRSNALPATLFASDIPIPSSELAIKTSLSAPRDSFSPDDPIPSIERPLARPPFEHSLSEPPSGTRLHLPPSAEQAPRTPPAQTNLVMPETKQGKWDMQRAASACSHRSNSSISSGESYATRPTSFDGSATSPDCDNQDPFSPQVVNIIPDTPTRRRKKLRSNNMFSRNSFDWSIEMDNHLFNVYQMYLADPTVTPFKTMPGSIPPTGVCHRVARRAKETWPKASRIDVPIIKRYRVRNLLDIRRSIRDRTPELNDFLKTDDALGMHDARRTWPSESSTRKRLKQLCREKFTISAHYQRLRESRSPSPFADQFIRRPTPRLSRASSFQPENDDRTGSYTTRELGISLVASDATAPLARIVADDTPVATRTSGEWFSTPVSSSDQMTLSTPSTTVPSAEPDRLAPMAARIPRLASPFNYSTWNGASSKPSHRRHVSHNQYDTIHATGTRLLSPFRPEPDTSINVNKRRAQHNLEEELSPSGSNIKEHPINMHLDDLPEIPVVQSKPEQELMFTGIGDIGQRRIRIRNRGATLGAAFHLGGQDRVERLFAPPLPSTSAQHKDNPLMPGLLPPFATGSEEPANSSIATNTLALPELDPNQKRLGSPFELDPNRRSIRNRSPRHFPSLSDPFISTDHFGISSTASETIHSTNHGNANIGNIGERLALFGSVQHQDATPQ